jgi:hypothetical protein
MVKCGLGMAFLVLDGDGRDGLELDLFGRWRVTVFPFTEITCPAATSMLLKRLAIASL